MKYQAAQSGERETGAIRSAALRVQATAQGFQTSDFNYEQPKAALFSQAGEKKGGVHYQHPGRFSVKADGDALAAWKVNALTSQAKQLVGEDDCAALTAGHWFTLTDHDDKTLNTDWLVTAVTHDYDGEHYRNRFTAIPKATCYRPQSSTPKPVMHTQTATVVGKQERRSDRQTRAGKVQFPWIGKANVMKPAPAGCGSPPHGAVTASVHSLSPRRRGGGGELYRWRAGQTARHRLRL